MDSREALADRLDAALPQTQCRRCGYADCRRYAEAIAAGEADVNRCPPGGAEGVARLAAIAGVPARPLDPGCGREGPLALAIIDEAWCIGCTLCIKACPVDCIVGAPKQMHTVIAAQCTGCELCLPACPVDCIAMVASSGERTGWAAWSEADAAAARDRYRRRSARLERDAEPGQRPVAAHGPLPGEGPPPCKPAGWAEAAARRDARAPAKLSDLAAASSIADAAALERKRATVEAAIARARAQRRPA